MLGLQNLSKRNNEGTINGQGSVGEVTSENKEDGNETTPAQKNDMTTKKILKS